MSLRLTLQEFVALNPEALDNVVLNSEIATHRFTQAIVQATTIWDSIAHNFRGTAIDPALTLQQNEHEKLTSITTLSKRISAYLITANNEFSQAIINVHNTLDKCRYNGFRIHNNWQLEDTIASGSAQHRDAITTILSKELNIARQNFDIIDHAIANTLTQFITDNFGLLSLHYHVPIEQKFKDNCENDQNDQPVPHDDDGFYISPKNLWPPIFGKYNIPCGNQIHQGALGDCTVHSTLAAIADCNPELLCQAITEDPKNRGNYYINLIHDPQGNIVPIYLTHTEFLEHLKTDHINPANEDALWPYIIEAAYAKYRDDTDLIQHHYLPNDRQQRNAIRDGVDSITRMYDGDVILHQGAQKSNTIQALTGKSTYDIFRGHWFWQHNDNDNKQRITDLLHDKKHILIYSFHTVENPKKPYFISSTGSVVCSSHAYQVVSIDGDMVTLRNPWGAGHCPAEYGPLICVPLHELCDRDGSISVGSL